MTFTSLMQLMIIDLIPTLYRREKSRKLIELSTITLEFKHTTSPMPLESKPYTHIFLLLS